MRVQIPPYTDRWMMGDRYGEVLKIFGRIVTKDNGAKERCEVAHVKLDKSGKTVRVILDDCTVIDDALWAQFIAEGKGAR
jgi:hypothetical protein